jgi:pimeloyl-ACP methyl ester carboxylesterase
MLRRTFLTLAGAAGGIMAARRLAAAEAVASSQEGTPMPTNTTPITGYAPVNGLEMYYEVHGNGGTPLVLIHGAFSTIDLDFGRVIPALAATRQVIAVELQGHGRTADIDRPLSYELMAGDIAALLNHLEVPQADIFGYSIGAAIATELALQHPDLVRKLVMATPSFDLAGLHPELTQGLEQMTPDLLYGSPYHDAYLELSPHPEHFDEFFAKKQAMDQAFEGWSAETIQSIEAPALLIAGDSDIVRPEHVVEMFRLFDGGVAGDIAGLPPSRLAILPGTTHVTLVHRGDWLAEMITEFLDAPLQ